MEVGEAGPDDEAEWRRERRTPTNAAPGDEAGDGDAAPGDEAGDGEGNTAPSDDAGDEAGDEEGYAAPGDERGGRGGGGWWREYPKT